MPNQNLLNFISQELVKGTDKQAIINSLLSQGWQQIDIDTAFSTLGAANAVLNQSATQSQNYNLNQNTIQQTSTNKRKILIIGFVVIIIIILFVFTMLTAFAYDMLPIKNYSLQNQIANILMGIPFMPKTPRFVLEASANAHLKTTKYSFDASIAADSSRLNTILGTGSFDAQIKGSLDYTDINKPLVDLNAKITKDFSLDLKTKDQILYFRINSIPALVAVMLNSFGFTENIQKQIIGKWLFIDTKPLNTDARTALDNNKDNNSIQQGFKDYLDAFNNPEVLKSLSMTSESLNDISTYKIHFAPDDKVLNIFWDKYIKADQNKNSFSGTYKISDGIKNLVIDIWIDKKSYLIQKSAVRFLVKASNFGYSGAIIPLTMVTPQTQDMPVSASVTMSDFNKPVTVDIPENAVKFDDFLKSLMSQMQTPKNQTQPSNPIPTPTPIPTISAYTIGLSLKNGSPGKTVIAAISNPIGITSAEYELTYMSQGGIPRGAIGIFDLTKKPVSKEITLGRCTNVCTYDQGVYDLKILLKLTKIDGITYQSQATLGN